MKNLVYIIIAILVIGGGWWWYTNNRDAGTANTADSAAGGTMLAGTATGNETAGTDTDLGSSANPTVVVDVSGANFRFSKAEIRVKEGDTVQINFTAGDMQHDWVIDEFSARTAIVPSGQSSSVTFVADKKGTFEYYCSVGQHRQMGMKGTLTVQ